MSTETLGSRAGGQTVRDNWFNTIKAALSGDLVPRNPAGVPTDESGTLGTEVFKWLKAYLVCGEWNTGDIKPHHTFNGEQEPGEGWMLCDGRIINETNYDLEHGAGAWDAYVGTSPIDGKYLPNLVGRYPVGKDTTTQTGASAITPVGNTSSTVDLSHFHKIYSKSANPRIYDSSGSPVAIAVPSAKSGGAIGPTFFAASPGASVNNQDVYTDKQLSTTQSIKPDSIEVTYYMRII